LSTPVLSAIATITSALVTSKNVYLDYQLTLKKYQSKIQ